MKRVVAIFLIILCATSAYSGTIFRGLGKRLNVYCLGAMNSSGVFATGGPDSADISAYRDDGSSAITVYRKFTSLANMVASSGWFDTTNNGGYKDVVMTVYVDSVAGTTPTGTMVTVKVKLYTSNVPTETNFNVYVSSGLNNAMAAFDGTGGVNLKIDSLIGKRIGIYNTVASTTTNDYGAVEFSTTGDSSFAFVVKNTGIAGAKFKGSAFKLYSKTHSGILSIGGATGSPTSGGVYFLDSSANGYGQYVRSTSSGYGATYTDDGTSYVTTLGPIGGDIVTDWITATALRREACQKIAQNILKDTTKRIGFKGGLGDSVLTPIPTVTVGDVTLAAGQFTKIKDTVNIAANIVAARDSAGLGVRKDSSGLAYRVDSSGLSVRKDSSGLAYRSQPDSITQKQAKIILGDTTKRVFPGILNDTTKRIKFSNDSVVAIDPIRTVAATVAGGATSAALQVAQDSLNALTAITRADSNLTKAVRDTAHIIDSIVKLILPLATQARDTLLTFPTWLAARFDTMMVAAGWADSSRTTNTYLNDADTVRVYKGENLWFKYIRLHPAHVPGYRPDSTRGRGW